MSAEAFGDCWKRSPFREPPQVGKMLVHLAIADVVNDVHENRFWMLRDDLGSKALASRSTVDRTLRDLIAAGWLTVLTPGVGRGHATEYRYSLAGKARHGDAVSDEEARHESAESASLEHGHPSLIPRETKDASVDEDFETWISTWGQRRDKAQARRHYAARRSDGVSAVRLLAARDGYLASVRDPQFIMSAARFLRSAEAPWNDFVNGDADTVANENELRAEAARRAAATGETLPVATQRLRAARHRGDR